MSGLQNLFYPVADRSQARGLALIITNSEYRTSEWMVLNNTHNDGDLAQSVWSMLGYKVCREKDLTGEKIMALVDELANEAVHSGNTWDSFVFHYSGHGYRMPITYDTPDGKLVEDYDDCVVGVDGVTVSKKAILDRWISSKVAPLAGKPRVFLWDCCRGVAFERARMRGRRELKPMYPSDYADMLQGLAARPYHTAGDEGVGDLLKGYGTYSGVLYSTLQDNFASQSPLHLAEALVVANCRAQQDVQKRGLYPQSICFESYLTRSFFVGNRSTVPIPPH